MHADAIRRAFLAYFAARGHREVPSASLVPADDPTLLFTNAGMVQFKRTFLGQEPRDYVRAVSCQKCVRAGGKHNDLEQVGLTKRHHTFFEMLGNFSFGDYFKREAIGYAWDFVTGSHGLALPPDRLRITVHHTDAEARQLWQEISGLPADRIYGLGDADNFWQMGDTGPCGPCSEIYVDLSWKPGHAPRVLDQNAFVELAEAGVFLEIWNLVFMQFDRGADGTLTPLPRPSVDTGAGLERIAAVMQGEDDNFHSDLLQPLLDHVAELVGRPYPGGIEGEGASFRVLADHARAVAFLLADGVYPSNEGRGYVLRRILRRAVRHAWLCGRRAPTLAPLLETVQRLMGSTYPELVAKADFLRDVTATEEERFLETIEGGLKRLDDLVTAGTRVIGGDDAFRLYDTFGFPIDLTQLIARERGVEVDLSGFEAALEEQRTRSRVARGAGKRATAVAGGAKERWTSCSRARQRFVGYEQIEADTEILAFRQGEGRVEVILRHNPFYVESGGQVSDRGVLDGAGWSLTVDTVRKTSRGTALGGAFPEPFEPTAVRVRVDAARRRNIERNHSATHLVHLALRRHLGSHVRQQGSLVEADRLRFDFSHHGPIDPAMLHRIEQDVNEQIWANAGVVVREMAYPDALALGAMAFFADKYGDVVRVVQMGDSIELCGGTHVTTTGALGLFHVSAQGGVAAGVRRIEAVTGPGAYAAHRGVIGHLEEASTLLKARPDLLARRVEQLLADQERLETRLAEARRRTAGAPESTETLTVQDLQVHVAETDIVDRGELGAWADRFRAAERRAVLVLLSPAERGAIHVAMTEDLVAAGRRAGDLVNRLAAVSGGRGGGRPAFASASAGNRDQLPAVRAALPAVVAEWLRAV